MGCDLDTFANSHIQKSSVSAESAAKTAKYSDLKKKRAKYSDLTAGIDVVPIAIESTTGVRGASNALN